MKFKTVVFPEPHFPEIPITSPLETSDETIISERDCTNSFLCSRSSLIDLFGL